ncbi:hypothetical protein H1C71_003175 [Ictidomys tridecemlineatus]|nr:hypothetical protein H1C71_003175 [Ictidomys tridecemlineatus]
MPPRQIHQDERRCVLHLWTKHLLQGKLCGEGKQQIQGNHRQNIFLEDRRECRTRIKRILGNLTEKSNKTSSLLLILPRGVPPAPTAHEEIQAMKRPIFLHDHDIT